MKNGVWIVLLLVASTLAIGCGSGEEEALEEPAETAEYEPTAVDALTPGMSQDDVRNRLGEPRTRVTMDGGQERWTYYLYGEGGEVTARTLILFGDDGKVVDVYDMNR